MADSDEVSELAEYYIEMYWTDNEVNEYARNILDDYLDSQGLSHAGAENLLRHGIQGLDKNKFRNKFATFLESRLDRNHNGSIENTERNENDLDVRRKYLLGYFDTELAPRHIDEAFMTSIIHFQDSKGHFGKEIEYLDKEEGLEAIKHLLEHNEEKVREMVQYGLKTNPEKATEAYKVVARESPALAEELLKDVTFFDESLESSIKSIYFNNNPDVFRNFRDQLDF